MGRQGPTVMRTGPETLSISYRSIERLRKHVRTPIPTIAARNEISQRRLGGRRLTCIGPYGRAIDLSHRSIDGIFRSASQVLSP